MPILSTHPSSTKIGENPGTGSCILEPLQGAEAIACIPMPVSAPSAPLCFRQLPKRSLASCGRYCSPALPRLAQTLKNHSLAPALLMPKKTVMSEASLGIWKRTAPSAPSLPCMRSLNQDDKANSNMCWDLFPQIPGFLQPPSPPHPQNGRPRCGQQTELDSVLGIQGNGCWLGDILHGG